MCVIRTAVKRQISIYWASCCVCVCVCVLRFRSVKTVQGVVRIYTSLHQPNTVEMPRRRRSYELHARGNAPPLTRLRLMRLVLQFQLLTMLVRNPSRVSTAIMSFVSCLFRLSLRALCRNFRM